MRRVILPILTALTFPFLLCQCLTTQYQTGAGASRPPVTVEGTLFYPDENNVTYHIPEGAEIIGAGGKNCHFIVEEGGRMTAHSGYANTYEIMSGGSFKGFDHPATKCEVVFEEGAIIEQLETGERVSFRKAG